MAWEDFWSRVRFWDDEPANFYDPLTAQERTNIETALQSLYATPTGQWAMDEAVESNDITFVDIPYLPFVARADTATNFVELDFGAIADLYYINNKGMLVQEIPALTLIHEIIHLGFNVFDPPPSTNLNAPNVDQRGLAVQYTNAVAQEMGWTNNIRASYFAGGFATGPQAHPGLQSLQLGWSYSENNTIDVARIGNATGDLIDHSLTDQTGKLLDLIFGFGGNDIIRTGLGNDYVYGGADNDTLVGGEGSDYLHGGDGFSNGLVDGFDTADYSTDPNPITATYNTSTGVLQVMDGTGGTDTLVSIEKIIGTTGGDTFVFPLILQMEIDGNGGADTLNGSPLSGVRINLDPTGNGTMMAATGDSAITLANFDHSTIIATGGDDTFTGGGFFNVIYTGAGEDTINWSPFVTYADLDNSDTVFIGDWELTGALRWTASEFPFAWSGSILYGLTTAGELSIRLPIMLPLGPVAVMAEMLIENYVGGPGVLNPTAGITIADIAVSAFQIMDPDFPNDWLDTTLDAFKVVWQVVMGEPLRPNGDPLVLDLDNDGLELLAMSSSSPLFDMDDDNFAEHSGWVASDDAFLVYDVNANGAVDGLGELFGSPTQTGFAALAGLDTNSDNVINASDSAWGSLRVWRDLDFDGVSDAGELTDLTSAGIQSFSLVSTPPSEPVIQGNEILSVGTFTRTDLTTGSMYDVNFTLDNFYSVYLGDTTVSPEAAALPNLAGHGILTDLRIAMTNDPAVLSAVQTAMTTMAVADMATLRTGIESVFRAWGATASAPEVNIPYSYSVNGLGELTVHDFGYYDATAGYWKLASGNDVLDQNQQPIEEPTMEDILAQTGANSWAVLDGEDVAFLESYYGDDLPFDTLIDQVGSGTQGIKGFIELYNQLRDYLAVAFAVQGPLADYFPGITYDISGSRAVFTSESPMGLVPVFEEIFQGAPSDPGDAATYFSNWDPILDHFIPQYSRGNELLLKSYSFVFSNLVAAYENVGAPLSISAIADIFDIPNVIVAGAGTTNGTAENDIFYLGAGDQTVTGGNDHDVYVIGENFGDDVITDIEVAPRSDFDMVRFAQYLSTDVSAVRVGTDLVITVTATGDTLTVTGQFDGQRPALLGGYLDDDHGVDEIVFADGTVWTPYEIAQAVSRAEATSDTLTGTMVVDHLDGGAGNDTLQGGDDGDVYVFGSGYGQDTVHDEMSYILLNAFDMVFLKDLALDDVTLFRDGPSNDLEILVDGSSDKLTVTDQFQGSYTGPFGLQWFDRVELFVFSDGNLLSWEDIFKELVKGTDQDDTIYGFFYPDEMAGGLGNDYLSGGDDGDIYRFNAGDGDDTIEDLLTIISYSAPDRLIFGPDIVPDDVSVSRDGNSLDLVLTFEGSGDSITIVNQFQASQTGPFGLHWFNRIESFEFDDQTVWDWDDIIVRLVDEAGTSGADTIYGFSYADTIRGRQGNDALHGGNDSDSYVFNSGDGVDTIEDNANNILFEDEDKIVFGTGIDPSHITAQRQGSSNTIVLNVGTGGDQIVLVNQYARFSIGPNFDYIEEVHFANWTVIDGHFWRQVVVDQAQTAGNDSIYGFEWNETLAGGSGNDYLEGRGDADTYLFNLGDGIDTIEDNPWLNTDGDKVVFGAGIELSDITAHRQGETIILDVGESGDQLVLVNQIHRPVQGPNPDLIEEFHFADATIISGHYWRQAVLDAETTSGNDTIVGTDWQDTLAGGAGDDRLEGKSDGDTYLFNVGDGQDVIHDYWGIGTNVEDKVVFGAGILPADLFVSVSGDDLIINFVNSPLDLLTIEDYFAGTYNAYEIEEFHFANQVVWFREDLLASLESLEVTHPGTTSDDVLTGTSGDDVFQGGLGADTLNGLGGKDIYLYSSGDGNDSIFENYTEGTADRLKLGPGLTPANVVISRSGASDQENITLTFSGGGSIYLWREFYAVPGGGVEKISFDGGPTWTKQNLANAYLAQVSTGGNDTILGFATFNDVITAGAGNDTLNGLSGNDTYVYNVGDGADVINEAHTGGTLDRVSFGAGILPSDVTLSRSLSDTDDLTLNVSGGGSIFLNGEFYAVPGSGVELITFANGTTWDLPYLRQQVLAQSQTSGNDTIYGYDTENDTLQGGLGNDALDGLDGDDTYIYNLGDGNDSIYEFYINGEDLLLLGPGILPAEVSVIRSYTDFDDITLKFSDGGSVLLNEQLYPVGVSGIEEIKFDNNTIWSETDLLNLAWFIGTPAADTITVTSSADKLDGLGGNDTLNGSGGNDLILGGTGDDTINGGTGDDTMVGGAHNDTYIVDATADVVTEASGEGVDSVQSSATYTLSSNVENLTLTGSTSINATGNSLDNMLTGNSNANTLTGGGGNDTLDGGAGADLLAGGAGDDTYVLDASDSITELSGEGFDSVQSASTVTLPANVESVTLTGSANINATGNSSDNTLIGNSGVNTLSGGLGNDSLDGGLGADSLVGGVGDDLYFVENGGDAITELNGEGTDLVQSSVTYTLSANVENLTLTGSATNGTGNSLNNTISGTSGNNILDGGTGADALSGGDGNDTFVVDDVGDTVTELSGEGTDTVQSSVSFLLSSNVEHLTLTGSGNVTGTGNSLDNTLTGNSGTNALTGGAGNDTYVVGAGDTVTESSDEGTDTVQSSVTFILSANVENLTLTGSGNIGGTGNGLDNILVGNAGANALAGGAGNDTYLIDSTDTLTENSGEGNDTVQISIASYTLGTNLENLTLTGSANINGTGNSLANTLTGNSGTNTLDGGAGADTMIGGAGNDTYLVDDAGDVVTESSGEGTDTVQSSVAYALAANIENLTLTGTENISATGNSLDNILTGNSGANTLTGGAGNETYVIDSADTVTEVSDEGTDTVQISAAYTLGANLENLTLTGSGNYNGTGNNLHNVLTGNTGANVLAGGAGNDTYVIDGADTVTELSGEGIDTIQISATHTLGVNFENLTLTGTGHYNGTGNSLDNILIGNSGDNILNGDTGADMMSGGDGSDTYTVDNTGDTVTESGVGVDTVNSSVSFTLGTGIEYLALTGSANIDGTGNVLNNTITGNSGVNTLTGGDGIDTLNGGGGADTMIGGLGNDTYIVDNAGDTVTESSGEGTDLVKCSVTFTLSSNVENLELNIFAGAINGTGNELNNIIWGNSGTNTLTGGAGDDYIDGSGGTDTMIGGTGNDTYVVRNTGITVTEAAGEGIDTVHSLITYTLGDTLENLTLFAFSSPINGTGNGLDNILTGNSGNNTLTGDAGNDTLDGAGGTDTLVGGTGNDIYVIDSASDTATEATGEGTDTVQSWLNGYTLASNLENLTLFGSITSGTGNSLDNVLTGNGSANTLSGGDGNDTINGAGGADTLIGGTGDDTLIGGSIADNLTGGAGSDAFVYGGSSEGGDTITDFSHGTDTINVSALDAVSGGTDDAFTFGGTTATANGIWYTEAGGNTTVRFDTDGNTGAAEMTLTLTGTGLGLTASDFVL